MAKEAALHMKLIALQNDDFVVLLICYTNPKKEKLQFT